MIVFVEKVNVVSGNQSAAQEIGQVGQLGINDVLLGHVLLHFDEEAIRTENIEVSFGNFLRRRLVALQKGGGNLAAQAGAGGDDPLAELAKHLLVDARLVI